MSADELFAKLEPPPGGTARFAHRLEAEGSKAGRTHRRGLVFAAAAAVAAIAVAIVVLVPQRPNDIRSPPAAQQDVPVIYDSPAFDRLLGRPLQTGELSATVGRQPSTLTELESQNNKVRIYRID